MREACDLGVQVSQECVFGSLPEDRNGVATADYSALIGLLEAVLVADPVVPVAERVVVSVVLKDLDLAA